MSVFSTLVLPLGGAQLDREHFVKGNSSLVDLNIVTLLFSYSYVVTSEVYDDNVKALGSSGISNNNER